MLALTDERDRFFDCLERRVDIKAGAWELIGVHPAYEPYRSDPRFVELLRKMNLAQ